METELGPQVTSFISSETYFRAMARGDLTTEIFLYLRALVGFGPLREKLLKLLLVKYDDQSFSGRLKGLIIALPRNLLVGGEEIL